MRRTQAGADGVGTGLVARSTNLTIEAILAETNEGGGIALNDVSLTARDVVVRDDVLPSGRTAIAVGIGGGTSGRIERAAVLRSPMLGFNVSGVGTLATLADVSIRDTRSVPSIVFTATGIALQVHTAGVVELQRVAIDRASTLAVLLDSWAEVTGADVAIRGTLPTIEGGAGGYAIQLQEGSAIDLERCEIAASLGVAVSTFTDRGVPPPTATFTDLSVTGTAGQACAPTCNAFGTALLASIGASITATRFRIADNLQCGVQLVTGGTIDLHDGIIEGNLVGANVQDAEFDLGRLQDRVIFRDNVRDLDSAALPVPGPIGSGGA